MQYNEAKVAAELAALITGEMTDYDRDDGGSYGVSVGADAFYVHDLSGVAVAVQDAIVANITKGLAR